VGEVPNACFSPMKLQSYPTAGDSEPLRHYRGPRPAPGPANYYLTVYGLKDRRKQHLPSLHRIDNAEEMELSMEPCSATVQTVPTRIF
jgi:hypothetical protein